MENTSGKQPQPKLWTKDFTIITLGSIVSMLGNTMAYFAISLFVLDYTEQPFLYAIYIFLSTLPQIFAPMLAGSLMDKFSRRKTIYMLDFSSAGLYICIGLLIHFDVFSFVFLGIVTLILGTIHGVYNVAFTSFYPMLITEGNYGKAYSVSSTLDTLSFVMIPVATLLYNTFGLALLLFINSVCFVIAAIFEVHISNVEATPSNAPAAYSMRAYIQDTKEGVRYLISEKGLLLVTIYFAFSAFSGGASQVITLPWFRESFANGEYVYMSVWLFMVLGRVIGGALHYRLKLPVAKKYAIAFGVYIIVTLLEGTYLYLPLNIMRLCCFLIGICGVTSYNIRISATQTYVPNERKGRFNGAFLMFTTVGSLVGQLVAGGAVTILPMRMALSAMLAVNLIAVFVFVGGGKKHIAPLYNRKT